MAVGRSGLIYSVTIPTVSAMTLSKNAANIAKSAFVLLAISTDDTLKGSREHHVAISL